MGATCSKAPAGEVLPTPRDAAKPGALAGEAEATSMPVKAAAPAEAHKEESIKTVEEARPVVIEGDSLPPAKEEPLPPLPPVLHVAAAPSEHAGVHEQHAHEHAAHGDAHKEEYGGVHVEEHGHVEEHVHEHAAPHKEPSAAHEAPAPEQEQSHQEKAAEEPVLYKEASHGQDKHVHHQELHKSDKRGDDDTSSSSAATGMSHQGTTVRATKDILGVDEEAVNDEVSESALQAAPEAEASVHDAPAVHDEHAEAAHEPEHVPAAEASSHSAKGEEAAEHAHKEAAE